MLHEYWQMGGWPMFPLLLLGLLGLGFAPVGPLVSAFNAARRLPLVMALLELGLGLLTVGLGLAGQQWGLYRMEEALDQINPADQQVLRMAGQAEARVCLTFGLLCALAPLLSGTALLGTGLARLRRPRSRPA